MPAIPPRIPNVQPRRRRRWPWIILAVLLSPVIAYHLAGLTIAGNYTVPTSSMEPSILVGDRVSFLRRSGEMPERGALVVFLFPGTRNEVTQRNEFYIDRCVAIAGDTLQVIRKALMINGALEQSDSIVVHADPNTSKLSDMTFPPNSGFTRDNWGPMRIPKKDDVIPLNDSTYMSYEVFIRREGHTIGKQGDVITIDEKPATSYTVERDYVFGMGDNRDFSLDSRFWGFIPVDGVLCSGAGLVVWSKAPDSAFRWNRTFATVR